MSENDEVIDTLDRLNGELQDLLVRGLRVCGPEHLGPLRAIHAELLRVGAEHLAERLATLTAALEADTRDSAAALLLTQSSLRVFERVLTLAEAEVQSVAVSRRPSHHADERDAHGG